MRNLVPFKYLRVLEALSFVPPSVQGGLGNTTDKYKIIDRQNPIIDPKLTKNEISIKKVKTLYIKQVSRVVITNKVIFLQEKDIHLASI